MKPITMFLFMVVIVAVFEIAYSETTSKTDPHTQLEKRETATQSIEDAVSRIARHYYGHRNRHYGQQRCRRNRYNLCRYYSCRCHNGRRRYCRRYNRRCGHY